jgi:hypothetical protein
VDMDPLSLLCRLCRQRPSAAPPHRPLHRSAGASERVATAHRAPSRSQKRPAPSGPAGRRTDATIEPGRSCSRAPSPSTPSLAPPAKGA